VQEESQETPQLQLDPLMVIAQDALYAPLLLVLAVPVPLEREVGAPGSPHRVSQTATLPSVLVVMQGATYYVLTKKSMQPDATEPDPHQGLGLLHLMVGMEVPLARMMMMDTSATKETLATLAKTTKKQVILMSL